MTAPPSVTEALAEFDQERELNPLYGEVYDRLGDAYLRQAADK